MVTLVFHAGKDAGDGWPEPPAASARAACGVRCVRHDWMRERGGISSAYTLRRRQIVQLVFQCTGRESRHSGALPFRKFPGARTRALQVARHACKRPVHCNHAAECFTEAAAACGARAHACPGRPGPAVPARESEVPKRRAFAFQGPGNELAVREMSLGREEDRQRMHDKIHR